AIFPTKAFLGCVQLGAAFIPPAAFGNKCVPNKNFLVARFSALLKTPIENFLVRPALKGSGGHLIVINPEKPGTTRVKEGWIFHPEKITRSQPPRNVQSNFVEHSRKIDKTFGLAIVATGSLHDILLSLPFSFVQFSA